MISRLLSYPADKLPSRKLMYRSFEAQKEYKLPGGTRNKDRIGKHDYIIKLLYDGKSVFVVNTYKNTNVSTIVLANQYFWLTACNLKLFGEIIPLEKKLLQFEVHSWESFHISLLTVDSQTLLLIKELNASTYMLANYVESNLKDKLFGIFEPILILLLDRGCEEIFNKFYSNFEARLVEYKELRSEKENIVEILFGLCEYLYIVKHLSGKTGTNYKGKEEVGYRLMMEY